MKVDVPVLRRLGPVPFWRGEHRCLDQLGDIYRRAMSAASRRLGKTEEDKMKIVFRRSEAGKAR